MSIYSISQEQFDKLNKSLSGALGMEYHFIEYGELKLVSNFSTPSWNKGRCGEKHHRWGKQLSDDTKKLLSDLKIGKKKTKEHIKNMSDSLKGRTVVNKGQKGVFFWYNNGVDNYFLKKDDLRVETLQKGRIRNSQS